jgi:NhaP-type Na+/H+ or K+/H+ antiporter
MGGKNIGVLVFLLVLLSVLGHFAVAKWLLERRLKREKREAAEAKGEGRVTSSGKGGRG